MTIQALREAEQPKWDQLSLQSVIFTQIIQQAQKYHNYYHFAYNFNTTMKSFVGIIEESLPSKKIDIFGTGGLMMTSFPYYLLSLICLLAYVLIWNHAWALIVIIYALLPLLDELFTMDLKNPSEAERRDLQRNDILFKLCLYITVLMDWFLFFKIMAYFSQFEFSFSNCMNLGGLFFIFSNLNAVQFAVAHEIFHKPGLFNKILGTVHMSKNLYMHFTYEHLFGHHRRVATPEDPASSRQGENVYTFFIRSFTGSYKSVYLMEKEEANKPFYLNYAVLSVAAAIAFSAAIYYGYGFQTLIFFLFEAYLSIFYLQAINYIEHYGLFRKKLPNGEYEKVTIRHSWNAPHRFSNYILFKLQRHSDHHENSLKPYQTLLSLDESPHLPHGYSLTIMLSFFPSEWRKIMDPLVEQYKKVGVGNIETEVTTKAIALTRKFAIKLGIAVTACYAISLIQAM